VKIGIKALRWLSFFLILWMAIEVIRVYYFCGDLARFLQVAQFLLGPWFAIFAVAAGGSHFKRWTEALTLKAKNGGKTELQGIVG